MFEFNDEQIERYSRNLILKEVGGAGQRRLQQSRVLIVGAGGLGSPAAMFLAAAGVGTIGIIDDDTVDLSNLQRQLLHSTEDVGTPKVDSARRTLSALNPETTVEAHKVRLDDANAADLIANYDVVVCGVDNFPTRYAVNDACVAARKPFVEGGILRWVGTVLTVVPGAGPCYRCLYPESPPAGSVPSCQEAGVIGALAGVIGSMQAVEAVKLLLNVGRPLQGRLLIYDGLYGEYQTVSAPRRPNCPACGSFPTPDTEAAVPSDACNVAAEHPVAVRPTDTLNFAPEPRCKP